MRSGCVTPETENPPLVPTPLSKTCPSWGTVAATYHSQSCKKETILTIKKTETPPFARPPTLGPKSKPAPLQASRFSGRPLPPSVSLRVPSHTNLPPPSVGCPGHCVTQEIAQTEACSRPRRKEGGRGRGGGLAWPQGLRGSLPERRSGPGAGTLECSPRLCCFCS